MGISILSVCYLIASISFILGLRMLSHPLTARKGNLMAAGGMSLAIVGTIFLYRDQGEPLHNYGWIFGGIFLGGIGGTAAARKVKMTAMPEMVSLFNGMGGACAALISLSEFSHLRPPSDLFIIFAGLIIGSVSFAGSIIAWGKLSGKIKDIAFKGQHAINLLVISGILLVTIYTIAMEMRHSTMVDHTSIYCLIVLVLSLLYGVFFVLPIGGADMPVVISLLNSFTGVAAACGGFLYDNKAMLTGGILVGAAGTLLTILMCKAMNRSLLSVLWGSFSQHAQAGALTGGAGVYKEISIADASMVLAYAREVMIVPGYGLAVAQAQHACHELEKLLESKGVTVRYAIHPVAGRMPGHMNVLLAEADVSYDKLLEMEQANDAFPHTDVVLVLGANDVVNPAALTDPTSPIYGMPILEVEKAKLVIVNKRSMKPGYAGIDNQLFFQPRTSMLFGDAKNALQQLITAVKEVE